MRQFLTGVLVAFVATGAAGLFALGFLFASAFIFTRMALQATRDYLDRLRGR